MSRTGRRRVAAAAALALVLAAGACGGDGGGGDDDEAAPLDNGAVADGAPNDGSLKIVATDEGFSLDMEGEVRAGYVPVEFVNDASRVHQITLRRLKGGADADAYASAVAAGNILTTSGMRAYVNGGLPALAPGRSQHSLLDLDAGPYVVTCFMNDGAGGPYVQHGFLQSFEVGRSDSTLPTLPRTAGVIELGDFSLALPAGFDGQGDFEVRNTGLQPHEVVLVAVDDEADAARFHGVLATGGYEDLTGEDVVGGLGPLFAGKSGVISLDLPSGRYVAFCLQPDPGDRMASAAKGMVADIVIP